MSTTINSMGNLYTPLKIFHFQEKLDSLPRQVQKILPPLHVRIKPTNACNHRCRYCAYRADRLQLGQDMKIADAIPRAKMLEIIEDIIEMGVKAVTFSGGGEPLIYPHLPEALRLLADSPVKFATLTNGALLKGAVAELFARHGAWVRISLDGWDGESYARYRGVHTDVFKMLLDNIKKFKQMEGPCLLGISYIIDQDNHNHVREMITRLKDLGVDSVKLSPCIVDNDGERNNAYHRPFFADTKEQISRAHSELADNNFEIFDAYHELDKKFDKNYDWCPYCQVLPVIGADQRVYTCQDKAYNLKTGLVGSIRDQRFRAFWQADKGKFFKTNPAGDCRHHCVANKKNKLVLDYLAAAPGHLEFV